MYKAVRYTTSLNNLVDMLRPCLYGEDDKQRCELYDIMDGINDRDMEREASMMMWAKLLVPTGIFLLSMLIICCFGTICLCACCKMTSKRGIFGRLLEKKCSNEKEEKRKAKTDIKTEHEEILALLSELRNYRMESSVQVPFPSCPYDTNV